MSLTPDELRLAATGLNLLYILTPDTEDLWVELASKLDDEAKRLEGTACPCGCEIPLEDRGRREINAHLEDEPTSPYYRHANLTEDERKLKEEWRSLDYD